jgi:hypothetical protein
VTGTVTVPVELALGAIEGTARLPVRRRAPPFEPVVEKVARGRSCVSRTADVLHCVSHGEAAAVHDGCAGIAHTGFGEVRCGDGDLFVEALQLLLSLLSGTRSVSSARASKK